MVASDNVPCQTEEKRRRIWKVTHRTTHEKDHNNEGFRIRDGVAIVDVTGKSYSFDLSEMQSNETGERRDVILKAIIRDIWKFFVEDFNSNTFYLKRKKQQELIFYQTCLEGYLKIKRLP